MNIGNQDINFKDMRCKIIILLGIMRAFTACEPVDNGYNTGISNGKHDCSMFEYFQKDSYNWDSTMLMIQRAGLESLFQGNDSSIPEITFWGPTNHSIRRFMLNHDVQKISDMSLEFCRQVILMHVMRGRVMKSDINFRIPDASGNIVGASTFLTEGGVKLKAYREQGEWGNVENAGAISLFLLSETAGDTKIPLASPDIETLTGVVHSLNYNYTIGDMLPAEDFEKLVEDLM